MGDNFRYIVFGIFLLVMIFIVGGLIWTRVNTENDLNIVVVDVEKIECEMRFVPYNKMRLLLKKNCGECHSHSQWMESQENLDRSLVEQYLIYGARPLIQLGKTDEIHQTPKDEKIRMISYFCVPLIEKARMYK